MWFSNKALLKFKKKTYMIQFFINFFIYFFSGFIWRVSGLENGAVARWLGSRCWPWQPEIDSCQEQDFWNSHPSGLFYKNLVIVPPMPSSNHISFRFVSSLIKQDVICMHGLFCALIVTESKSHFCAMMAANPLTKNKCQSIKNTC